jgi:hypothetical protein
MSDNNGSYFGAYIQVFSWGLSLGYHTKYGIGGHGFVATSLGVSGSHWEGGYVSITEGQFTHSSETYLGVGTPAGTSIYGGVFTIENGVKSGSTSITAGGGVTDFLEGGIAIELSEIPELPPTPYPKPFPHGHPLAPKKLTPATAYVPPENRCFLAGTPIDMWDGTQKPIEEIAAGVVVVSYDASGDLKPGQVKRTFENRVAHILDVHGLMVTPGHATYCADGKFTGRHVPMIDILRSDGALMPRDGKKVRAATNCLVGSLEDRFVKAVTFEDVPGTDSVRILDSGEIRLGTRYMRADGATMSVLETIRKMGASLADDGHVILPGKGEKTPFFWTFGKRLPRPEDYVLQRSQLTLNDIYEAEEWEAVGPQMPPPYAGEAGPGFSPNNNGVRAPGRSESTPNIPLAMRGHPNQPTMSRRQRRAMDARQRKQARARAVHRKRRGAKRATAEVDRNDCDHSWRHTGQASARPGIGEPKAWISRG